MQEPDIVVRQVADVEHGRVLSMSGRWTRHGVRPAVVEILGRLVCAHLSPHWPTDVRLYVIVLYDSRMHKKSVVYRCNSRFGRQP